MLHDAAFLCSASISFFFTALFERFLPRRSIRDRVERNEVGSAESRVRDESIARDRSRREGDFAMIQRRFRRPLIRKRLVSKLRHIAGGFLRRLCDASRERVSARLGLYPLGENRRRSAENSARAPCARRQVGWWADMGGREETGRRSDRTASR